MNAEPAPTGGDPVPDPDAMAAFLDTIFTGLEGHVTFRMIPEKGTPPGKPWTGRTVVDARLPQIAAGYADRAVSSGRGLYVVPATVRTPGRAREQDIAQTAVVIVDIDIGDIAQIHDHLVAHLGSPSLDVASGGRTEDGQLKRHLYWQLSRPATGDDLTRVQSLRAEIAAKVGSDPSVARITQPMRVAGSVHGKFGLRNPVTILCRSDDRYDLAEFAGRVAEMPALAPPVPLSPVAGTSRVRHILERTIREGGQDGVTRHDAITAVIGHWARKMRIGAATDREAWDAVQAWNDGHLKPPLDDARLWREFDAIIALDRRRHAAGADDAGERSGTIAAPHLSEDALALAFVEAYGARWRYVPVWGRWLSWTGARWQPDEVGGVRELVRQVCRAKAVGLDNVRLACALASARTIAAVERIASSDGRISLRVDDLDRGSMLLNTPAGIVDLATGEMRGHDPGLLLTQITHASPGVGCPTWLRFLDEVTDGDADLVAYLARVCGYCLSGVTSEQVFFFLHGQGANGKSVFLQTVSEVLGSYAAAAPFETFVASATDRHPTDLAGLRGARLVVVSETEAGRAWAEARIKAVTGGDAIRARYLHRDFFEFRPTFKLIFAGNHRPRVAGIGEAMRRRLQLVPFTVTIPPERRDTRLQEKLLKERDGILGWMLQGCLDWQRVGLAPPERTARASAEYFEDEDWLGQWIAERCVLSPEARATAAALYADWSAFCVRSGMSPGSQRSFGEALRSRGFAATRSRDARGWSGIALRRAPASGAAD